jgi:hypothetical protein
MVVTQFCKEVFTVNFKSRIAGSLLVLSLVAATCLRVDAQQRPSTVSGQKINPVAIIAILVGEPALPFSCEPGRPVVFLKVRVTNQGRASSSALPAGIEAYDKSTPPLRGTAALPVVRPGEVVEVTIPVNAPANPSAIAGKHEFQIRTAAFEHTESASSTVSVNIPAGFCRSASLRNGVENLVAPTPTPTPKSPNVPARPLQQQPPKNEPARHS